MFGQVFKMLREFAIFMHKIKIIICVIFALSYACVLILKSSTNNFDVDFHINKQTSFLQESSI